MTATSARVTADHDVRLVVESGHDGELGVLWLRLDALPTAAWLQVFRDECQRQAARIALHGVHVLCTATDDEVRRVGKQARRLIGATNGATAGRGSMALIRATVRG